MAGQAMSASSQLEVLTPKAVRIFDLEGIAVPTASA